MNRLGSAHRHIILEVLPAAAAAGAMIIGGLVLAGWMGDVGWLKSISPNWATMKVNTALSFILCGAALWLLRKESPSRSRRRLAAVCAAVPTLLALLTLGEYALATDLGIDELILRQPDPTGLAAHPGRMSPATAGSFLLLGLALLGLDWKSRSGFYLARELPVMVALIGLLAFTGYLYGVRSLYALSPFSSMAVHTALVFFTLSIGILCVRAGAGPMSILAHDSMGGAMARRLLPFAVGVPLFVGWLRLQGQRAGYFGFEFGLALFATSNVFVFTFLIWRTALWLNYADNSRQQAEAAMRTVAEQKRLALETSRLKSEFLANMSHELRTPLNGIIGFSQLLVDGKVGSLTPKQREYIHDILSSGEHLLQLINDVLDLSKVEAGKMELRPEAFSAPKVVEEVCAVVAPLAQQKKLTLEHTVAPGLDRVTLDRQKFKQVLFNLLSNAVKFTHEGGRVDLAVSVLAPDALRLAVRDTGIGIRREDLAKLFVEFQQLDSGMARRYQGTGLGLALTKKIVELQHGAISVESVPGQGSTFTVILPSALAEVPP